MPSSSSAATTDRSGSRTGGNVNCVESPIGTCHNVVSPAVGAVTNSRTSSVRTEDLSDAQPLDEQPEPRLRRDSARLVRLRDAGSGSVVPDDSRRNRPQAPAPAAPRGLALSANERKRDTRPPGHPGGLSAFRAATPAL